MKVAFLIMCLLGALSVACVPSAGSPGVVAEPTAAGVSPDGGSGLSPVTSSLAGVGYAPSPDGAAPDAAVVPDAASGVGEPVAAVRREASAGRSRDYRRPGRGVSRHRGDDYRSVCSPGRLNVGATGTVKAVPDLAVLSVSVDVERDTVLAARDRVAEVSARVVDAFRSGGVAEGDLSTSGYSVHALYDYVDGSRVLRGYRVSHRLTAEYREAEAAGALVDLVVSAGGDDLSMDGVFFRHSRAEDLSLEARDLAVAELLRRAERMARAAGRELGPLLVLSDGYEPSVSRRSGFYESVKLDRAFGALDPTDLPLGEDSVSASVRGEFSLLPEEGLAACASSRKGS